MWRCSLQNQSSHTHPCVCSGRDRVEQGAPPTPGTVGLSGLSALESGPRHLSGEGEAQLSAGSWAKRILAPLCTLSAEHLGPPKAAGVPQTAVVRRCGLQRSSLLFRNFIPTGPAASTSHVNWDFPQRGYSSLPNLQHFRPGAIQALSNSECSPLLPTARGAAGCG